MLDSISKIYYSQAPQKLVLPKGGSVFKTGEVFRGTVLKRFSRGDVLIEAKGKEFPAKTGLRLQPGTSYRFQAVRVGQRKELKVLDESPRDLKPLKELLSVCRKDGQKIGELLRALPQFQSINGMPAKLSKTLSNMNLLLPMMIYNGVEETKATWFSRFLQVSGLLWESKLAKYLSDNKRISRRSPLFEDLKGYLLALKRDLIARPKAAEGTDSLNSLREKIDQALNFIEQEQWLNLTLSRNGLGWYWFIPGAGEGGFQRAEILVDQNPEEDVTRFCLIAGFSKLGRILVEFLLHDSNIDLIFLVEDKGTEELMVEYMDELREGLEGLGFSAGLISCREEKIDDYMARLLEGKGTEGAFHLVI